MKSSSKKINVLKKIFFVAIAIYIVYIFIHQQKILNSYKGSQAYYNSQIEEKIAYRETLYETKKNINSEEYIEEIAREKLDMYLPNEKVFIDI
jgi:cell division protein FtsB